MRCKTKVVDSIYIEVKDVLHRVGSMQERERERERELKVHTYPYVVAGGPHKSLRPYVEGMA